MSRDEDLSYVNKGPEPRSQVRIPMSEVRCPRYENEPRASITITITSTITNYDYELRARIHHHSPFTVYRSLFTPISSPLTAINVKFSTTVADILDKFGVQSVRYLGFRRMVVA